MTYGVLKSVVKGLLSGDNKFPVDEDVQLALLGYGFNEIATYADALKLFTTSKDSQILRVGMGESYIRLPTEPKYDTDQLDLDHELGYPLARFMASFVSDKKESMHFDRAMELIDAYNSKVESYMATIQEDYDNKVDQRNA